MSATTMTRKLRVFQELNKNPVPIIKKVDTRLHCARIHENLLSISDQFEIMHLSRQEIKKLSVEELQAIKAYCVAYNKDYENGNFLFKRVKAYALPMADFEEAEAFSVIQKVMGNIDAEFKERV